MSLSIYHEDSIASNARSIGEVEVESCSKTLLAHCLGHGKSPCFLGFAVLKTVGVDVLVLVFDVMYGRVFLKCAF
jgi:hypothetical protein